MLGSGMTIKFFALFFWQGLGLEPVAGLRACLRYDEGYVIADKSNFVLG